MFHRPPMIDNAKVIQIVLAKGFFTVSWRYRDDGLRSRCNSLAKRKILKKVYGSKGFDNFVIGNKALADEYLLSKEKLL